MFQWSTFSQAELNYNIDLGLQFIRRTRNVLRRAIFHPHRRFLFICFALPYNSGFNCAFIHLHFIFVVWHVEHLRYLLCIWGWRFIFLLKSVQMQGKRRVAAKRRERRRRRRRWRAACWLWCWPWARASNFLPYLTSLRLHCDRV